MLTQHKSELVDLQQQLASEVAKVEKAKRRAALMEEEAQRTLTHERTETVHAEMIFKQCLSLRQHCVTYSFAGWD